jgi:hypothetical protein
MINPIKTAARGTLNIIFTSLLLTSMGCLYLTLELNRLLGLEDTDE